MHTHSLPDQYLTAGADAGLRLMLTLELNEVSQTMWIHLELYGKAPGRLVHINRFMSMYTNRFMSMHTHTHTHFIGQANVHHYRLSQATVLSTLFSSKLFSRILFKLFL